jgi:hypothetical protein
MVRITVSYGGFTTFVDMWVVLGGELRVSQQPFPSYAGVPEPREGALTLREIGCTGVFQVGVKCPTKRLSTQS